MEDLLLQYYPHIIMIVTCIIWLVRLEAKVRYNEQALKLVDEHNQQLTAVKEHLVEIKTDLKWLKESVCKVRKTVNQNS